MIKKIVLTGILLIISFSAHAEKKFYVYDDQRQTGSQFKRKLLSAPIPFDKSYDELTESQKQIVRSDYEGIPDTETPPFPSNGLESIYKPLIEGHISVLNKNDGFSVNKVGGATIRTLHFDQLVAIAMVGSDGKVKNVEIYKTPDKFLGEFVSRVLLVTEFDPGTCNGQPCDMEYLIGGNVVVKDERK